VAVKVVKSQLAKTIVTPRINFSCLCEHKGRSCIRHLKVFDAQILEKLHSVGRKELTKDTFAPNVQLTFRRKGSIKAA